MEIFHNIKYWITSCLLYFLLLPTRQNYVPRTSWKEVLRTFPYGPLCNAKRSPLPTIWAHPLPTSLGRWNMASRGRPKVTSWERPHTVLYVTPRDVPHRRFEVVSYRPYGDVPYGLTFTSEGPVLPTSRGRPKEVLIWFYN